MMFVTKFGKIWFSNLIEEDFCKSQRMTTMTTMQTPSDEKSSLCLSSTPPTKEQDLYTTTNIIYQMCSRIFLVKQQLLIPPEKTISHFFLCNLCCTSSTISLMCSVFIRDNLKYTNNLRNSCYEHSFLLHSQFR